MALAFSLAFLLLDIAGLEPCSTAELSVPFVLSFLLACLIGGCPLWSECRSGATDLLVVLPSFYRSAFLLACLIVGA